jgi:uncharacterized membrane protein YccC
LTNTLQYVTVYGYKFKQNMDLRRAANYYEGMPERVDRLLAEVRAWCDQGRGRQTELAEELKIPRQRLNEWLRPNTKKHPTAEQALHLEEFLKTQKGK